MYVQLLIQMIDPSSTNSNLVSTRNPKLHDQSRRCCQIACILFSHSTYPWWSYGECICVNYPRRSQGRPFATTKVTQGYIAYLVGGKVYLDLFLQYGLFTLSILVDLLGQQTWISWLVQVNWEFTAWWATVSTTSTYTLLWSRANRIIASGATDVIP